MLSLRAQNDKERGRAYPPTSCRRTTQDTALDCAMRRNHDSMPHPSCIRGIGQAGSGRQSSQLALKGQRFASTAAITRSPSSRIATASRAEMTPRS